MGLLKKLFGKLKQNEATFESCEAARQFEATHTPGAHVLLLDPEEQQKLHHDGILSWRFIPHADTDINVHDRTRLVFSTKECCCQTNYPLYVPQNQFGYFEVTITHKAPEVVVAIGLATKPYPHWRFPGWNKHSIGFHSDDGKKYWNDDGLGEAYSHSYDVGDTIGCGWNPDTRSVFFTRNGESLGTAFDEVDSSFFYFPTVASDGNAILDVNLGKKKFLYKQANTSFNEAGILRVIPANVPPPDYSPN